MQWFDNLFKTAISVSLTLFVLKTIVCAAHYRLIFFGVDLFLRTWRNFIWCIAVTLVYKVFRYNLPKDKISLFSNNAP